MAAVFAIKNRIRGVESTGKITGSMKLVSTSKLHRTQNALKRFRVYSDRCTEFLAQASWGCGSAFPLLEEREDRGRGCYVLFIGDRGLCGSYNQDITAYFRAKLRDAGEDAFSVICGRLGRDMADDPSLRVKRVFDALGDTPGASDCLELSEYLRQLYLSGECDRVYLIYQQHRGISQRPETVQLLPVVHETKQGDREYIYEPDRASCIRRLCDMYMDSAVYRVLLEAKVGEHFARMTAMTSATDNAEELLRDLRLKLNRTRQARITTEINEVAGGARALHKE